VITVIFSYAIWYRLRLIRDERERIIRDGEARYRFLAASINDVIWTMDTKGCLTYVSPSIERLTGHSAEEVVNRRFDEYMPPDSAERAHRLLAEDVAEDPAQASTRENRRVFQFQQYKKDGTVMWVEITSSLMRDAEGRPTEVVGVTRDITERRRQEEERRLQLDRKTVDHVSPGEQQPEADHNLQSSRSSTGVFRDAHFRHARGPGWFSYDLKVDPDASQALLVRYWGQETGRRTFDLLVDRRLLATENPVGKWDRPEFVDVEYPLPADWLTGQGRVTVRFQGHPGHMAGGIYDVRILRVGE
jgi:PAS domain S-box-containing protein